MFTNINGFAHDQINHVSQKIRTIDAPSEVTAWVNRKVVKKLNLDNTTQPDSGVFVPKLRNP